MSTNFHINRKDELKGSYTYDYPRPALTADCVIFGFDGNELRILLVERGVEPFKGYWALPGGFMRMDETIDECARRELFEETGVRDVYMEQFHVFSDADRDPRGRVVTVAFVALVRPSDHNVVGGDDAVSAVWFSADALPPLAFDHDHIVTVARRHLRKMLQTEPAAFRLLDNVFTVDEVRKVYEAVNGATYDRRNFQRKLMQSDLVEEALAPPLTAGGQIENVEVPMGAVRMCKPCIAYDADITESEPMECKKHSLPPVSKKRKPRLLRLKPQILRLRSREVEQPADAENEDSDSHTSIKDLFNF